MMKRSALLTAGLAIVATNAIAGPLANSAESKRVLLVFAEDGEPAASEQTALLKSMGSQALRERDLVVLFVPSKGETRSPIGDAAGPYPADALRRSFDIAPTSAFTALLVGKDGGVKWRATRPTRLEEIFSVIDAMPMRRNEMKRNAPPV